MEQPVGGGVDQEPELVGRRTAAGGAIRGEVQFVGLDQILGLAACTVDFVVKPARRAGDVGDDEAAVGAFRRGLDPGDHLSLDMPASRGIAEGVIAADLFGLSFDPGDGDVLGQGGDLSKQGLVAGEPEDVADPVALAPAALRRRP